MHTSYWLHEILGILWVLHCLFITQNVRTHTCIDILLVYCWVFIVVILFRSKLEYAIPAWNITASNANKLECGIWKFATLSLSLFFLSYSLQLRYCTSAAAVTYCTGDKASIWCSFFHIHIFPRSKFCPSLIDNSSLQVPSCNITNLNQISAGYKNCPCTRYCKFGMQWYRDILIYQIRYLTHSLQQ